MTGRFTPQNANYEERIRASFTRQQFMGFIGARLVEVRSCGHEKWSGEAVCNCGDNADAVGWESGYS